MVLVVEIIGRYLIYLILLFNIVGLFLPRLRRLAIRVWLAVGITFGLGWLIKDFFYLPRPFILTGSQPVLPYLLDGSFPSNHTAAAVAVAFSVFIVNRKWGLVFLILAALVAVGRILGGVHSYLDVIAGTVLGILVSLLTARVLDQIIIKSKTGD